MAFFEIVDLSEVVFVLLTIVAPIAFGLYAVVFNRRFSLTVIRQQKAVWKVDFSPYETVIRIFSVIVGTVLVIGGLVNGAQLLFPWR